MKYISKLLVIAMIAITIHSFHVSTINTLKRKSASRGSLFISKRILYRGNSISQNCRVSQSSRLYGRASKVEEKEQTSKPEDMIDGNGEKVSLPFTGLVGEADDLFTFKLTFGCLALTFNIFI